MTDPLHIVLYVYIAAVTIAVIWLLIRDRRSVKADDVLAVIDGVEDHSPCADPGCVRARIDLRNLARS